MSDFLKIYSLQRELLQVEENLRKVETEIIELKEALKWMEELNPIAIYKNFGRVALEIPPEKGKEIIEQEIKKLEKVKEYLSERRERLVSELRQLQVP
jgi:chaperonin cofactor prefoldin